jgi:Amt family ammonium transporter
VVFLNTVVATGAAMVAWLLVERIRNGHATSLGAASGIVAGLVAITPACSSVDPLGAMAIGAFASAICALAVSLKYKLGYDDSLDVVGLHLVAGLIGSIFVGLFATAAAPAGVDGLFYGGGSEQLVKQIIASFAVLAYSFIATYIIAKAIDMTIGFRIKEDDEVTGIDLAVHAESSYEIGSQGANRGGYAS